METLNPEKREPETTEPTAGAGAEREGFDYGSLRLSQYGPGDFITLPTLAVMLGRHPESVKRIIRDKQLPVPIKLAGTLGWTQRALVEHLEHRLVAAQRDREKLAAKMARLVP